jgi:antitoxin (DNA-binding transcriptional repressor) of toxin-antitoxin stability system
VTVTVDRRQVAQLVPLRRRRPVPIAEALAVAARHSADRGLLAQLSVAVPDTTEEL